MCARYTLTSPYRDIVDRFGLPDDPMDAAAREAVAAGPRYNIAPTQKAPVIIARDGRRRLGAVRWGLIPSWARDAKVGVRSINARAETLARLPTFRDNFARHRCLVPADGFYEWRDQRDSAGRKLPVRMTVVEGHAPRLFAFAGLWDVWRTPEGEKLASFTIVTVPPNDLVRPIHDRMPAILRPGDDEEIWLDPRNTDTTLLATLLAPYPADAMALAPASTFVNAASHEGPQCWAADDAASGARGMPAP